MILSQNWINILTDESKTYGLFYIILVHPRWLLSSGCIDYELKSADNLYVLTNFCKLLSLTYYTSHTLRLWFLHKVKEGYLFLLIYLILDLSVIGFNAVVVFWLWLFLQMNSRTLCDGDIWAKMVSNLLHSWTWTENIIFSIMETKKA